MKLLCIGVLQRGKEEKRKGDLAQYYYCVTVSIDIHYNISLPQRNNNENCVFATEYEKNMYVL
jgi:hypothetical protein